MNLHLVNDEKVIPRAIQIFENYLRDQNTFLCFKDHSGPLQFFPEGKSNCIVYANGCEYEEFVNKFDRVIIHFLNPTKVDFCNRYLRNGQQIVWLAWGGDLYNQLLYSMGFSLFTSDNSFMKLRWPLVVFNRCFSFMNKRVASMKCFVMSKVDAVAILPEEAELLRKYLGFSPKKIISDFFYYPISSILGDLKNERVDKSNHTILCGNCASITNNHEHIFRLLSNILDINDKVVVPLSYGGTKWYKGKVVKCGEKLLGSKFNPIFDFMPLAEYNKLLLSSSVSVFANKRQEAMGNVLISLYLGSKVYLREDNPLYSYFCNLGVSIFSLNKVKEKETFWNDMDDMTIEKNREILSEMFNEEALEKCLLENFSNI